MNARTGVPKLAVYSRIFVILIQYFSNIAIPDHNAGVFLYPKTYTEYTTVDKIIQHFLGGFVRWDAQYFTHIAKYGYTYENTLAFFPLYPITVRLASSVIYLVIHVVNLDSLLLLVSVSLNIILFVLTTKLLFKLTTIVFNETLAYKTALLFCFNPASVFFTAPYTECMFTYFTFQSILNCLILYKKYSNLDYKLHCTDIIYLLPIALSTIVRSNGVLNIGFFTYTCLCVCFKYYAKTGFNIQFLSNLLITFSLSLMCLVPFATFQIYCYQRFCTNFEAHLSGNLISYAEENNLVLPGQFSKYNQSWCYGDLAYSYVQAHYWNVGLLKYYELKQIPNFLLATPLLFILINHCCRQVKRNFSRNIISVFSFDKLFKKEDEQTETIFGPQLNVFVIHSLGLSIFCCLFMHIQVATRMLCSATPLFYWVCASYFKDTKIDNFKGLIVCNNSVQECVLKIYFVSYFVVGTIMFSNFFPWT